MSDKEATARIKINKLLEAADWRFFQDGDAPANIRLEPSVKINFTDPATSACSASISATIARCVARGGMAILNSRI